MCGLAGVVVGPNAAAPSLDELRRMTAMLRHRGPDGYGVYRDERAGLAHTRLAILDLGGGAQPMSNEDGTVWVTFNGEIFNHVELRTELAERGHRFATRSDTEVIVHAYEEWGAGAWSRFNGQFAFGLWDARASRLHLVRDRVGILPLFWARAGGAVVFASEAKALFAGGRVAPRIDRRGLAATFVLWAVPAPGTIFEGVSAVPPGASVTFDERLGETLSVWWRPDLRVPEGAAPCSLDGAADRLEERLVRAVELRLRADVPVGAYLSGGLDSSLIAHFARRETGERLRTFSVRFADPQFDETTEQRRMAKLLGTDHHEIVCGDEDIRDSLADVVWHGETPLLRTGGVPLYLLSELVRGNDTKVVLTGEGADELLAGYDVFKEARIRRFWARQPASTARPELFERLHRYVADGGVRGTSMWREFYRRDLADSGTPFASHRLRWENTAWTSRFLAPDVRAAADPRSLEADLERTLPPGWEGWSPLSRSLVLEMATFLSPYLLAGQGDRVAMAHGVEVRYPFLDPDVVDLCGSLPDGAKLRGLRDKLALRRVASRHLPPEIWSRPKHPYRAPTAAALFRSGTDADVRELLSDERLGASGLIDVPAASRLVEKAARTGGRMSGEREEMAVVGLYTLQVLVDRYIDRFSGAVEHAVRRLGAAEPDVLVDRCGGAAAQGRAAGSGRASEGTVSAVAARSAATGGGIES